MENNKSKQEVQPKYKYIVISKFNMPFIEYIKNVIRKYFMKKPQHRVMGVYEINGSCYVKVDIAYPKSNYEIFDKRKDALFQNLLESLRKGKSFQDYKKSKYYNYYLRRLNKEHPEYINN